MAKYSDIQWEDEDESGSQNSEDESSDFAKLLSDQPTSRVFLQQGKQIEGTILQLTPGSDTVIVEISPTQTAIMDSRDLLNEEGIMPYKEGDKILAYVASTKGGIQLSLSLMRSFQTTKDLESAYLNQIPVKGRVTKDIKGGFEVTVLGKTAFCPVSKLVAKFVEDKTSYINKEYDFLIEKYEQGGRNLVVSREKLLRQLATARLQELQDKLGENDELVIQGPVTDIKDFGAMIDLGGIEGFLHISEISYARVNKPTDVLSIGETVRVKVLKIDDTLERPRISLSMKAVAQDPWTAASEEFKVGESYQGKVLSFGKFGTFVQLKPGLDGLIHLSEMSWTKRIHDPSTVLTIGDQITVRIVDLDSEKRRISLSLKDINLDPWHQIEQYLTEGQTVTATVEKLKGFGAICEVREGVSGLLPMKTMKSVFGETFKKHCSPPKTIEVIISKIDRAEQKVLLSLPGTKDDQDDEDFREYLGDQVDKVRSGKDAGSFGKLLASQLEGKSGAKNN